MNPLAANPNLAFDTRMLRALATLCACLLLAVAPARALTVNDSAVYMEDMTWTDIRARLEDGATVAIVPTGGTEQSGPHLPLGKHNFIVEYTAGEIARALGNAMVASTIPYSPAGRISPPQGHMKFPGTVSLSETTFAAVLEDTARSLKQHGFHLICFVGDHGGSQEVQTRVAERLSDEWRGHGVRVVNVSDYYRANGQKEWADSRGLEVGDPQAHAGFFDTSELMTLKPDLVRKNRIHAYGASNYPTSGASGDATQASAAHGRRLLALKVSAAVKQIRDVQHERR